MYSTMCTRMYVQTNKEERLKHAKQSKHKIEQLKFKEESVHKKKMAAEREERNLKLAEWKKEQILKQQLSEEALAQQAADLTKQKEKENARRVSQYFLSAHSTLTFQLAIKLQVSEYATQRAQERSKQQQLQEERSKEDMRSKKLANEEAKKFVERVSIYYYKHYLNNRQLYPQFV